MDVHLSKTRVSISRGSFFGGRGEGGGPSGYEGGLLWHPFKDISTACLGLSLLVFSDRHPQAVLPQPQDSNIGDQHPRGEHLARYLSVFIAFFLIVVLKEAERTG